jgi:probable HAF family extracellular repeat protein
MGTTAQGLNDAGQVVGDYHDSIKTEHGYLYTP